MMSLEEAIEHAEGVADEKLKNAEFIKNNPYGDKSKIQGCVECAAEHRQLATWLRELQERRKEPEIVRCGECKHKGTHNCIANILATIYRYEVKDDFYCGLAERRTDADD